MMMRSESVISDFALSFIRSVLFDSELIFIDSNKICYRTSVGEIQRSTLNCTAPDILNWWFYFCRCYMRCLLCANY